MVGLTSISLFGFSADLPSQTLEEGKGCESLLRESQFLALDSAATEEASKIMVALSRIGKPIHALDVSYPGLPLQTVLTK